MAQYTKANIRGLLLQDPRIDADSYSIADSNVTQATPIPGLPSISSSYGSRGRVVSSGDINAEEALDVYCLGSGLPKERSAHWGWAKDGETAAYIRGWDPPWYAMNWQSVENCWGSDITDDNAIYEPKAIETKDNTVLICYTKQDGAGPTAWQICVGRKAVTATSYTETVVEDSIAPYTSWGTSLDVRDVKRPVMLQVSTGDILLYFWEFNAFTSWWNIKSYVSRDDGVTWAINNKGCLTSYQDSSLTGDIRGPVGYAAAAGAGTQGFTNVGTISVAEAAGAISLFCSVVIADTTLYGATATQRASLCQYVSSDFGHSFEQVDSWGGALQDLDYASQPKLVSDGKNIQLYFIHYDTGDSYYKIAKYQLISPYVKIATVAEIEYISAAASSFYVTQFDITFSNTGNYYIFANVQVASTPDRFAIKALYSTDFGSTWSTVLNEFVTTTSWIAGQRSSTDMQLAGSSITNYGGSLTATVHKNSVLLFTNASSNSTSLAGSIGVFQLGGWTNVNMPPYWENDTNILNRTTLYNIYVPYTLPGAEANWTTAGAGTGTLANGYYQTATTAGQTLSNTDNLNTSEETAVVARWCVLTSTTEVTGQCGVRIITDDDTVAYDVAINMYNTGFRVYNVGTAATVATVVPAGYNSLATKTHFIAAMDDAGKFNVWYYQGEINGDVKWVLGYEGVIASSATATGSVRFGNLGVAAGAVTNKWYYFNTSYGDDITSNGKLAKPVTLADRLGFPMYPDPTYCYGGINLSFKGGPFINREAWNVGIDYDYSIKNVIPTYSPSPAIKWRNNGDAHASEIVFTIDSVDETKLLSTVQGVYLKGINWKSGEIQGYNGSTWVKICDITATIQASLPYARAGSCIKPSGTAFSAARYIRNNELVGCTVDLGGGKLRRVLKNTSGYWTDSVSTKHPIIYLDGVDGTEGASGTCDIWGTEVFSAGYVPHTTSYSKLKLVIDSTETVDNYYEIGTAVIGPFIPFSQDHSFGEVRALQSNVSMSEDRAGKRRSKVMGDNRRICSFAWQEGFDNSAIYSLTAPTILASNGTHPVALRGDIAEELTGIFEMNNGSHIPMVFIKDLDYDGTNGTSAVWNVTTKDKMLYGRMIGDLEVQNVLGNNDEEVVQVNTIVIEEEI